jgi:NAD(P)-dependent dehydrogenase (short-subunit alcohol dehydrogenase family)
MNNILDGRVAVVTGSGRGLGRAYAMAIAQQGAKVVVNDLGCETDGTGSSHLPADQVADEINNAGGIAVANYDSVITSQGAERIIETAINKFGKIDILVNNAGIIRDNLIFDTSDEDFDMVVRTHLYGTFNCTRAACRIMKEQRYGRIVNVSSMSGFGNIGQVSYSAAKEAIAALTRTVARDLVQFKITCNAIRPAASTRLGAPYVAVREKIWNILGVTDNSELDQQPYTEPEDVAPLIVYLVSEQAKNVSSRIFEVHGNYLAIYDDPPQKAQTLIKENGRFTEEELIKFLPLTITKGIIPPSLVVDGKAGNKLKQDAKGWRLSNNKLTEVQPM